MIKKRGGIYKMTNSEYLENWGQIYLEEQVANKVNENTMRISFQKGDLILREGEKSSQLYFIIKGLVRGYYIDEEGNDITKCFSRENQFCSSEGLRTGKASSFTIECLEDCECIAIPYSFMRKIIEEEQKLNELFKQCYLEEVGKLEERARKLMIMSAKERYEDFCINYPILESRVPLQYIASYIGIRPASLSRIRKELHNN